MGSGDWFKTIISLKKSKGRSSKHTSSASTTSNAFKWKSHSRKESIAFPSGAASKDPGVHGMPVEDIAATRIQTAFRAYMARKTLRNLKGIVRLQVLTQNYSVKRQATATLTHLHSWSKIQSHIRARRICMVMEGRIKQKKLENQLKLEAKLHDLEADWCGGSETMEEILAKIHQREEAAVKRERAMAYAFSHQWRANSSQFYGLGKDELGKANWGWSWKERWIAARPWESRVTIKSTSPKKTSGRPAGKMGKSMNPPLPKQSASLKDPLSNGKGTLKARKLSYPAAERPAAHEESNKADDEGNIQTENLVTLQA